MGRHLPSQTGSDRLKRPLMSKHDVIKDLTLINR